MLLVNQLVGFGASSAGGWANAVAPLSLDKNDTGWNGYTVRVYFPDASIVGETSTKVRVTFSASSAADVTNFKASISHSAGSPVYDSAATPVSLLFSGGSTTTLTAGVQKVSDETTFVYNGTSGLVIAMRSPDTPAGYRAISSAASVAAQTWYKNAVDEVGSTGVSGYTDWTGTSEVMCVERIEFFT